MNVHMFQPLSPPLPQGLYREAHRLQGAVMEKQIVLLVTAVLNGYGTSETCSYGWGTGEWCLRVRWVLGGQFARPPSPPGCWRSRLSLSLCGCSPCPGPWARGTGGLHPCRFPDPPESLAATDVGGPAGPVLPVRAVPSRGKRWQPRSPPWPSAQALPFYFRFSNPSAFLF